MATEQIKNLANISKKSVQQVESVWNQIQDQLKNNPLWKKYEQEKNDKKKQDWLNQYNGLVLKTVKQKLGIKPEVAIESVNIEEESAGAITTTSVGSPINADGTPARFKNSSIYAPKIGSTIKRVVKKKKYVKESEEYINNFFKKFVE